MKRRIAGAGFRGASRRAEVMKNIAEGKASRLRALAQEIEGMSPQQAEKAVRGLVSEFGGADEFAFEQLKSVMPQVGKRTQAFKDLKRLARENATETATSGPREGSFNIMGQELLSPKSWSKVKKSPITYGVAGAGAASLARGRDGNKRKGNVTIVQ